MFDLSLATILFQVVNFLVLLGVLSWFFYRPIRKAIEEREQLISSQIEQARQREREAEERLKDLEAERARARDEATALLHSARESAASERAELIEKARAEAGQLRQDALKQVDTEERSAETRLALELRQAAVSIAGDLIRTAAGPSVHEGLVDQFLDSFPKLDRHQRDLIREAMERDPESLTVETAYPLDIDRQGEVREHLAKILDYDPGDLQLRFEVRPELICGIRFVAGTAAIDLSLSRTLDTLSESDGSERAGS